MKGRKIILAQFRVAEQQFELSITNFHLLCRTGQCDVKFVFERKDVQTFSNRWGWEQKWSHFIKEIRMGNCSSKDHTAKVEMFSDHQKKNIASIVDRVTAGQDTRALLQSGGEGLSSGIGAAEQGSGHKGLEATLLHSKPTFGTNSLHGFVSIPSVPQLTAVKHGEKSGATSKGWLEGSATTVTSFESHRERERTPTCQCK